MNEAANIKVSDNAIYVTQNPYVCIFCGSLASEKIKHVGLCSFCLKDAMEESK